MPIFINQEHHLKTRAGASLENAEDLRMHNRAHRLQSALGPFLSTLVFIPSYHHSFALSASAL